MWLVSDGAALWAGPASARAREQRCCTKWADRIGGRCNRGQTPAQRRLLRTTKQIKEKQNPTCRGGDSEEPTEDSKIRLDRGGPHKQGKGNRENEAYPFEEPANLRVNVGSLTTHFAFPAFPKAHRQNRDPEQVPHIEGPDGNGSTRRLAPKAVVIAKRNSLRPETVGAANDEHVVRPTAERYHMQPRLENLASRSRIVSGATNADPAETNIADVIFGSAE